MTDLVYKKGVDGAWETVEDTDAASTPPFSFLTADLDVRSTSGDFTFNNVVTQGSDLAIVGTEITIAAGVYFFCALIQFGDDSGDGAGFISAQLHPDSNFDWFAGQDDPPSISVTVIPGVQFFCQVPYQLPPLVLAEPHTFTLHANINTFAGTVQVGDGTLIIRRLS